MLNRALNPKVYKYIFRSKIMYYYIFTVCSVFSARFYLFLKQIHLFFFVVVVV